MFAEIVEIVLSTSDQNLYVLSCTCAEVVRISPSRRSCKYIYHALLSFNNRSFLTHSVDIFLTITAVNSDCLPKQNLSVGL
jgi:hypothetical protein